jgi:hypothetical protein
MKLTKGFFVGLGVLLILAAATGVAYASDPSPVKEPERSPFFEATLQQAVDELDGKVTAPGPGSSPGADKPYPTQHYTSDPNVWPECGPNGYTWDVLKWPACHYTTDPKMWPDACGDPYPTLDYTWHSSIWDECGREITQDPEGFWCDPQWTRDSEMMQCDPAYTQNPDLWVWCLPSYTRDSTKWPWCGDESYTRDPLDWPECDVKPTTDPYLWPMCHYTSDPGNRDCEAPYPTQDYTSNPKLWTECDPAFTTTPNDPPCEDRRYTTDPKQWPECDPFYTTDLVKWPLCHYTTDPTERDCEAPWPTQDYTWDSRLWDKCGPEITHDTGTWWCDPEWTWDPRQPLCDPLFTLDTSQLQCDPGYTYNPGEDDCTEVGYYTSSPNRWVECKYATADARIWPECHYTSDPSEWRSCGKDPPFPTRDYTTDPRVWPECDVDVPPDYTTDPAVWPACHYTSDPANWPDCKTALGDLGDAPDSSNHTPSAMTAYPSVVANFPTVFDPATGSPQGPKHWNPTADAWLGPWVTQEQDADQLPDEDPVTNIEPAADTPDRDGADDGLLFPVSIKHCVSTVISYTLTVTPGASTVPRYVNVWFDWNRDGDWADTPECPDGKLAPEWAVQNQLVTLGPGTHVLQTPAFVPFNKPPDDPIWMRISVAERYAPPVTGSNLADGRGPPAGYRYGETEDYHLREQEKDYDIYMKDNWPDDGSVPSSAPTWNSPDIWIRNDGDCTQATHQNPVQGTTTTVCVRVRNRMATPVTNVSVDLYWANAAMGLWWPGSFTYLGSMSLPGMAGGAVEVRKVLWNVPNITGHFCLLARAKATEDPTDSGPDTIVPVHLVYNNNNIVQKNTFVVDFPKVTECGFRSSKVHADTVYFDAVNTWNQNVAVDIVFDSADFPLGTGKLVVEPGSLLGRWTSLTGFDQAGQELHLTAFPASMAGIPMTAHETATMSMTVSAEIDERFTISVKEKVGTKTIGGIDYIRRLPVCRYLPLVMKRAGP